MEHCATHEEAPAAGTCRRCLGQYCDHCLVYAFGASKPPYCITCALDAAGVAPASTARTAARPSTSRSQEPSSLAGTGRLTR